MEGQLNVRIQSLTSNLKASASIVYMCSLQDFFLLKITPRHFVLFINGKFRPLNVRSLVFIEFYVPAFTSGRH